MDQIREAFLCSDVHTVSKAGTVSQHSNTHKVDLLLTGTKVELVYGPG
ncbi:hypothetical protein [Paeniglutamicibacter gangotriensis]|nr:hypothetical protein [Paeniglutamicibacter gangotriensis]